MHKYFKELDKDENVVGHCSIYYKDVKNLENYKSKCVKTVEISKKEYDKLRKPIS
jgi:hypothetical protein